MVATVIRIWTQKKAGVAGYLGVSGHAGLLVNEPPGMSGLLFI
jgi:hypothetical protein